MPFMQVAWEVLREMDYYFSHMVLALRDSDIATYIFTGVTLLADVRFILAATVVASLALYLWHNRTYIFPLWISVVGSTIFSVIVKEYVQRPRPDISLFVENSFSFPSGHATVAMVFYGFLMYFLISRAQSQIYKFLVAFLGLLTVLAVGFSRVYFGVHYLSDVLGGYLVGMYWLLIAILLSQWLLSLKNPPVPEPPLEEKST
ncbi:MAG: phosphatase PAP2 family protein [Patescibacteria group bacterium]